MIFFGLLSHYRGIKLCYHTIKLLERANETRLWKDILILENQVGFMPSRSTKEAIYLLKMLMELYTDKKEDLHMMFVDLKKACDGFPYEVLRKCLEKK